MADVLVSVVNVLLRDNFTGGKLTEYFESISRFEATAIIWRSR